MQRVFCSTVLVAALSVAGLTACGDKVNVVQPAPDSAVTAVTVTPGAATLNVGDKVTLVATVTAGPAQTNRNVTWTSSNSTVATVDNAGLVTAVNGGTATIVATSAANTAIKGAAVITVNPVVLATVTLGNIMQTVCNPTCTSVPATLNNVANQLDVTVNLDQGTQKVSEVDLIMNCGGADTIVAKQILSAADITPLTEDATAPLQFSFNTAAFNSATGVPNFKNGTCTLKAKAITTTGQQVASTSEQLTLNNADTVSATIKTTPVGSQKASATNASGLLWNAGTVTVTAVPVIYSAGASAASATISLVNLSAATDTSVVRFVVNPANTTIATMANLTPTSGVVTATFPKDMSANGVDSTSIKVLGVTVTTVTSAGNPGPTTIASAANSIRLDNLPPDKALPTVDLTKFNASGGWLGKAFLFNLSPDSTIKLNGAQADLGGVDVVTVTTQSAPFTSGTPTWTTFSAVTGLAETSSATSTGSYLLRLVVCDALNNCTNTPSLGTFGVDLTAPSVAETAGPTDHEIFNIDSVAPSTAAFNVVDTSNTSGITPSGPPSGAELLASVQGLVPSGTSSSKTDCFVGTNPLAGKACAGAISEPQAGFTIPTGAGEYTMTVVGIDQAGNQSAPITVKWYVDQVFPTVNPGTTIPNPIRKDTAFKFSASDNMDLAAGAGSLQYPGYAFFEPGTSTANGVAFDNVLTRTGTISVSLSTFFNSISTAPGASPGAIASGLNVRAVDAANNVSTNTTVAFPSANLPTAGTISNSSTSNGITNAAAYAVPAADTVGQTVTLSDSLTAFSATTSSPFTQVCFYYAWPVSTNVPGGTGGPNGIVQGELLKIGCTSGLSTSGTFPARMLAYSMTWSVPAILAGQTVNIFAVGVTSASDALITPIAGGSITVAP